jgi:hypothetical protein
MSFKAFLSRIHVNISQFKWTFYDCIVYEQIIIFTEIYAPKIFCPLNSAELNYCS